MTYINENRGLDTWSLSAMCAYPVLRSRLEYALSVLGRMREEEVEDL